MDTSSRLGLGLPVGADKVRRKDYRANLETVDTKVAKEDSLESLSQTVLDIGETVEIHSGEIQEANGKITTLQNQVQSIQAGQGANPNAWIAGRVCAVGDICYPTTASPKRMECIAITGDGKTGTTEPTWTGVGTLVTDGNVIWIIDDIRDGAMPGDICDPSMIVRAGHIKANGALITRAAYPRLFKFANDNSLIVTEANWAASYWGLFGAGDGSTTFRIPDLRGESIRGFDDSRGIDSGRILGARQLDALQGHRHTILFASASGGNTQYVPKSNASQSGNDTSTVTDLVTDGNNGTPRIASETRSRNVAYYYTIKY